MTIKDKYFPGTTVSRYLSPSEASWDENVYQSGKPVLDSELNLAQEVGREIQNLLLETQAPSGFLRGPGNEETRDFNFLIPSSSSFRANAFRMPKLTALVAGMPVVVEYSNNSLSENYIQLDAAPVNGGAPPDIKRTDFVFLEVFRALVAPSPHGTGTVEVANPQTLVDGDTITLDGVPLTARTVATLATEFQIGANAGITATNISNRINNTSGPYAAICTAQVDVTNPNQVNLRSVVGGTAGNITFVTSNPAALILNPNTGNFAGGVDKPNKPTQDTIYRQGNVLADPSVSLPDNIEDPIVGTESTQRVQIQYRIRVTGQAEAVDFKTENGFSNANVLAQGTQSSPVASYPFVPADGTSTSGNSSAQDYGNIDQGLFIAGDGSQTAATALGTVDGFVYAIPICFAFRRNDASGTGGFDPLNNTNGALSYSHTGFTNTHGLGVVPAGVSDRPDFKFHDVIDEEDVLDLRRTVSLNSIDLKEELNKQMAFLLDGTLRTWAIDAQDKNELGAGSGDVSWRFLVCNEIGRDAAHGGTAPISGDTTRGDTIANFDHIRRRFGDQSVVERRCFPVLPTDKSTVEPGKYVEKASWATGFSTWSEGDVIHIDLDNLNATGLGDWSHSTASLAGAPVSNFWPPGTKITNVLGGSYDDGEYDNTTLPTLFVDRVIGLGTSHVEIQLASNNQPANGGVSGAASYVLVQEQSVGTDTGSPRRIFVELEITYPVGSGTTDTPDKDLNDLGTSPLPAYFGPAIENDSTQRPYDWEDLLPPTFREGKREIALEYTAGGNYSPSTGLGVPITEQVIATLSNLILPRRAYYNPSVPITITPVSGSGDTLTVNNATTRYGSSVRRVGFTGGTVDAQLVEVTYFAQDPIPNFGASGGGYQISCYYRSNAPQTLGSKAGGYELPTLFPVKPLVMSRDLWAGNISVGSNDLPFPYINPSDQIAVNGDIPVSDFPGEWVLQGQSKISLSDFDADTGLLNLHTIVPADPNLEMSFSDLDIDSDFRLHYKVANATGYKPFVMARNLSNAEKHKVFFPILVQSTIDSIYFRKGEVLLMVISRFATLDNQNEVVFDNTDTTAAAIYRTKGIILLASER